MYDPENSSHKITYSLMSDELYEWRLGHGFRDTGVPQRAARGDFFTLPSPHYKPVVSLNTSQGASWGSGSGSEDLDYGPAGTFSYKVMHVWGRRPLLGPSHKRPSSSVNTLMPFYLSSPSEASDQITTTWGSGSIQISTPDIDYVSGYGHDTEATIKSYHHNGVEKWIFRARHATTTGSTNHPDVESDGIYYLWKIVKGYEATSSASPLYDAGQEDPVDKTIPLKDVHGHFHVRFDSYPESAADVLMSIIRRPDTLKYDTDVSRVPPECYGALIDLTCSYLVGRRDGEPKRESYYFSRFLAEVERLRSVYTFSGFQDPAFGPGLSSGKGGGNNDYEVKEG